MSTRERLAKMAELVMAIDAQQKDRPGYCVEMARSIVNAELHELERAEEKANAR